MDASLATHDEVIKWLDEHAKKWCFQKEKAASGYIHYQGRMSLKIKDRKTGLISKWPWCNKGKSVHFSPTSKECNGDMFYVSKEETRVLGPWQNGEKQKEVYVPKQIREIIELWPWQNSVIDIVKEWNTRHINYLLDQGGNIGKSILCQYLRINKLAMTIPFCNDYKDIMRMVMCMPKTGAYMIDLPKAINKERLYQLYSAIETIKGGFAFDDRYEYKYEDFDCPVIFVFSNSLPDLNLLTHDRWRFWEVNENKELVSISESQMLHRIDEEKK